jgi:hypothetical protein
VTIVLALALAPVARGELFQGFNRSLGIWWSDGYHATTRPPPQARWGHGAHAGHGAGYYEGSSSIEYFPTPAVPPETSSRQPAKALRSAR